MSDRTLKAGREPRTDKERLDFLVQRGFFGVVGLELQEGRCTNVQLQRQYIDNAMWHFEYNLANRLYSVEDQAKAANKRTPVVARVEHSKGETK